LAVRGPELAKFEVPGEKPIVFSGEGPSNPRLKNSPEIKL
jgi:hypothetical protein